MTQPAHFTCPEGWVPVPTHQVDGDLLTSWGFPVEKRDTMLGTSRIVRKGEKFHVAKHRAWCQGWLTIDTHHMSEPKAAIIAPKVDPEMLAFFQSITRKGT